MSIRQASRRGALLGALGTLGCAPTELGDRHAARVESYLAAPFTPADAAYNDPERALGPPDGRTVALADGSHIILRFFRGIVDGPGPDLRIYEVGPDAAEARIAVSADAQHWIELTDSVFGPTYDLDLATIFQTPLFFVRVRGLDTRGPEPGFDLDAVEALH